MSFSTDAFFKTIVFASLVSACIFSTRAYSNTIQPTVLVSPNKCVALTKGRTCYASISVVWVAEKDGDYCIFINEDTQALQCWKNAKTGDFAHDIEAKENVRIILKASSQKETLATAIVEISWLYSGGNRKRRWRLF